MNIYTYMNIRVKFRGKKIRLFRVISMHKYSVLIIQCVFIFKTRLGNIELRTSMLLHITEPEVNDYLDVNIPAPLAAHDMFGYCHFTAIFH